MESEKKVTLENNENKKASEGIAEVSKMSVRLEKWSFYLLLAMTFLLPLFFLPTLSIPFAKTILCFSIGLLVFVAWIFEKLKGTILTVPKNLFSLSAVIMLLLFVMSGLLSPDIGISFFGTRFEVGTVAALLVAVCLMFFASNIFKTKDRVFAFYIAFFSSSFLIGLYQFLRLVFGPNFLSFGAFTASQVTLIGKWNELGIFFGLVAILSLVSLQVLTLNRLFKTIWSAVLVISLFFLAVVNFNYVWWVVGLIALIYLVYTYILRSRMAGEGKSKFSHSFVSRPALIVALVALLYIFPSIPSFVNRHLPNFAQTAIESVSNKFRVNQLEVSPSWVYTGGIFSSVVKSNSLFGVGPHRFVNTWLMNKPDEVNLSYFWNTDFLYGIGLIPTYAITTGILGLLAILFFLGCFIHLGYTQVFKKRRDPFTQYLVISSYIASLYLLIFQVVYVPSETLFVLSFLFIGVFLACLYQEGALGVYHLKYGANPRLSFVAVLVLIVILLGGISLGYFLAERTLGTYAFGRASIAANVQGNVALAEKEIKSAISIDPRDEYYRALTDISAARIGAILNQKDVKQEQIIAQLTPVLAQALDSAQKATKVSPLNYLNWVKLGELYQAVLPYGYDKAYESSKNAYLQATVLSPKNPAILLEMARLEGDNKNLEQAKVLTLKALQLKSNYTEAIYFLSQIQVAQGNVKDAIQSVKTLAFLNPSDPTVFFQLGFLEYSDKNYTGAIEALERAVALNNQYSNARYFLGLSYAKLNRTKDALEQFKNILIYNPDNKEVQTIIKNLREGKDLFANQKPPADTKPEKRKKLPVKDTTDTSF